MTEEHYNERMKQIEADYIQAKKQLYIDYAASQRIYNVGDIISEGDKIIKVQKISAHKSFELPMPVYIGVQLKKDLTPKKKGEVGHIYGNDRTELIKGSKEVV